MDRDLGDELLNVLEAVVIETVQASQEALEEIGETVVADVKESMQPGTGRVYVRPGGRTHQASAPGQPPAVDEGRLRSSYTHEVIDRNTVIVGTNVDSAPALEFGSYNMAPRPHLRPAVERIRAQIPLILAKHVGKTRGAYITKAGRLRQATPAQIAAWTKGPRL